jgi:hypothetical protein
MIFVASAPGSRRLVTAATALSGVVAGTTIDTAVVKLPTWRRLGAKAWADYTREELPTSLVWYPLLGMSAVVFNMSAAIAVHRDSQVSRQAVVQSRVVGILAVGHLITTAKAVPHMLRVKERSDATSLQHALNGSGRWHLARTTADALTFAWNVRSLISLSKGIPAASN